ncbi:MAG: radical SAM family heme chaperone HemW [Capnocytophaga sp.]|nr:radical SAM family heme chaperone HemW [Capnocytophaga sp.]
MYSLYLHIPFCRQACHYCDFHFSTTLKKKSEMVDAICRELVLRKHEAAGSVLQTIYFGGGTPSLLSVNELATIMAVVFDNYQVNPQAEITLEANPDDFFTDNFSLDEKLSAYKNLKINRVSIGIQSFFDEDLQLMNRAHNATQTHQLLSVVKKYFDNVTIDLIYGIPKMSLERWETNLQKALSYNLPHISAYALTVEPKTALHKFITSGKIPSVEEEMTHAHFMKMVQVLESEGYGHYELSNFGKKGYHSRNNSAYWSGEKYMGIGPSAHSFDGYERSWNISNNSLYINGIKKGLRPFEKEILSLNDRYNELVMTGIRTAKGISSITVEERCGLYFREYLEKNARKYIAKGLLVWDNKFLKATSAGKFLTDGIASDLFMV